MTVVRNPLAYKNKRPFGKYVEHIFDRNRGLETCFSKTPQSAKVREGSAKGNAKVKTFLLWFSQNSAGREGPRRFREEKREAESDTRSRIHKTPQSAKVREASAKGNAKVET